MLKNYYEKYLKNKTLCFSPEVMIVTFVIEIILALYVFLKNRRFSHNLLIVSILVFLGTFQLAEYMICRGSDALFWSRIGLFAITFLPLLGFALIANIRNKDKKFILLGFLCTLAFLTYFIFVPETLGGAVCGGNYVILNINSTIHMFYGYYYFGLLLFGIWAAYQGINEEKKDKRSRAALLWMIIGYLSFILPLSLVYIFVEQARNGIASIMCGFALVFAFILTFKVAPMYHAALDKHKE
jgi:hypothetical protein